MKQSIMIVVAILAFTFTGLAQGIKFEHGHWASVKEKAEQENKIIFIDFYTSWCGPCKMLSKTVFPQKEVGDFYNKHIICYKIDAEIGEGPQLAQKYGVKAYPTLIFTDANGNFLHQGIGGMQAEALIELGKSALDPNKQLGNLFKNSRNDIKDMPAHLRKLSRESLPYNTKYESYIKSLSEKELLTKSTYDLMVELGGREAGGFTFDVILKNRKAFANAVGDSQVEDYFFNKYLLKAYKASIKYESIEAVYEEVKSKGFDFEEKIKSTLSLTGYNYEGKYDAFLKEAPGYIEKYGKDNLALKYRTVFIEAINFANSSPELKEYAFQLAKELIDADYKVESVNSHIGKTYADAGDLKTALIYYQKASDYSKQKGIEDQAAQAVDFLKKRIGILEKGDYAFVISGLEQYNGLTFKLFYLSANDIGEYIETEGVEIKEGKCAIAGNIKKPMVAVWGIYDGDSMKTQGDIILEPGDFKAKLSERNLDIENGWYNYTLFQALKWYPKYREALKKWEEWNLEDHDLKEPAVRKEYIKLVKAINDCKKEYYTSVYTNTADPTARVLVFFVGQLWRDNNAEDEIKKLKAELGDHYLLNTISHFKAEKIKNNEQKATVAVGKQIKPFKAKDLNGKEFKLEEILKKNKLVLVEFWASWCAPCRGLIPHLKNTYKHYHQKGFEIVSFSLDHKESMWRKASEQEEIPWINISDLVGMKSPIAEMYGVTGIPDSFLVDPNGKIIGTDYRGDDLDKELEELLSK